MKNYTITVNGNVYNVTVEEGTTAGVVQNVAPAVATPVATPAPAAAPAAPAKKSSGAGTVKVEAGTQGKVVKVDTSVGSTVKKGDPVVTIEAMKMEIPVAAPEDGTIASIDCAVGDSIEAGQVLATMN